MADKIKLAPPANTNTTKLSFTILEEEMKRLEAYTRCYNETYGVELKPAELIPMIVAHFLNSDRGYRTWRGKRTKINGKGKALASSLGSRPTPSTAEST